MGREGRQGGLVHKLAQLAYRKGPGRVQERSRKGLVNTLAQLAQWHRSRQAGQRTAHLTAHPLQQRANLQEGSRKVPGKG